MTRETLARPAVMAPAEHFRAYSRRLSDILLGFDWAPVERLAEDLRDCWESGRQVFLCGNGGSAGNANHLANDFLYPLSKTKGSGIRVHALSGNPAVITCLGNDEGYENIFAFQLAVHARKGDVLLALSGSGNSPNILRALEEARRIGMKSYAVLAFSGGKAKALADVPVHFAVDDMQIAEDTQTIIGHMIVQWLYAQREAFIAPIGTDR
ncbi:MAG: SIS domain-containing protein [Hyphomicrobiaceae bacterium]